MPYAQALAALADPTRRQVFEQLANGPRSVGELAAEMPVSRPAVSQHLKVLKDAGLVTDEADGTRRLYRVSPDGLGELRRWLDRFWDEALQAFQAHIDDNEDIAHASIANTGKNSSRSGPQKRARQRRRQSRI